MIQAGALAGIHDLGRNAPGSSASRRRSTARSTRSAPGLTGWLLPRRERDEHLAVRPQVSRQSALGPDPLQDLSGAQSTVRRELAPVQGAA